jgi:hypothetical protein
MRMEKELFGDAADPLKQHTGINFEKYEDIPVEATGAGVPEPVHAFTNPPLDPVLLENIGYAMYTTPTPVQKYSIPIVAGGRDLMACAQVIMFFINIVIVIDIWNVLLDWFRENRRVPFSHPFCVIYGRSSCPS